MMGVSMSLTYFNFEQRAARSGMLVDEYVYSLYIKAVRRAVVFYAIGLFLNNGFDYGKWRIPGVLQYFAISYLVTAVTILATWEQTTTRLKAREPIIQPLTHFDWPFVVQCYKYEWVIQFSILFVNCIIVLFAKAPGCPIGYNGPGGLSEDSSHYDCTVVLFLCVCLSVYVCMCMYVCACVYAGVYAGVCMCTYVCIYVCMLVCMLVCGEC